MSKIIVAGAVAAAVVGAGSTGAMAAHQLASSSPSLGLAVCDLGPANVVNTPLQGKRAVDVTWSPLPSSCGVDHYSVVAIDAQGRPQQVVAKVPAGGASAVVSGLKLCTFYRFGVQALSYSHPSGPIGAGGLPDFSTPNHPAFVSGPPDKSPPVITLLVTGTSTSGPADSFNPATANFCTSPNGVMPSQMATKSLKNLADSWLNYNSDGNTTPATRASGAGNNLIDSMAATGGYVLPYSYTGIDMTGTSASPWLRVGGFTDGNVADANPLGACSDPTCHGLGEPPLLQASLASIHNTFPDTPIIVIGHSLGGLIAEQWWLQYSSKNPEGVIQVISLDSPLNGVAAGGACVTGLCGPSGNPLYSAVGYDPGIAYSKLWDNQASNDPSLLKLDASNHLFTAIGDIGDPLYDVGDYPASHKFTGVKNIGLMSQVFWTEPDCAQSGYDLSSPACTATGQAIINPCGHPMNDGTGPLFDVPSGSMWIHSNVKNCPQVISDALGWYHHAIAHSSPTPSPAVTPPAPAPAPQNPCAFNTPSRWSPLCPDGPGGSFSPWDVVFFYYAYVNAGAYSDAWALMSAGWQATQGDYNRWKAGYAGANTGHVMELSQSGDIVNVKVTAPGRCWTGAYQVDNNKITTAHLSACTSTPAQSSLATPGFSTPQNAVDGFYQGELAGNWAAACSYVVPSAQSLCLAGTSGQGAETGSVKVDGAMTVGMDALVEVTGSLCGPGNISGPCVSNSDPSTGMPSSLSAFSAAYAAAVAASTSTSGTAMSPMPCSEIDGRWYVTLG